MRIMDGIIEINGLKVYGYHGVAAQERRVGNLFEVTMRLTYPIDEAVKNDSLDGTLNYGEAIDTAREVLTTTPSQLLEHAVGRLRDALMKRFPLISSGSITLLKLMPPCGADVRSVGVTISW